MPPVAERHADIAQHACTRGAQHGRALEVRGEGRIVKPVGGDWGKAVEQRRCDACGTRAQCLKGRGAPIQARVPRANRLTNITAEDAVAKVGP